MRQQPKELAANDDLFAGLLHQSACATSSTIRLQNDTS